MANDDETHGASDLEGPAWESASFARSALFARAAKLAAAGGALGGLGALANPLSAFAAPTAGGKIAVIEQQFGTFFTDNFNKPAQQYMKTSSPAGAARSATRTTRSRPGSTSSTSTTPPNYGVLMLSTGDQMSAWETSVAAGRQERAAIFINHCTQAVTGATQNVLFSHKQAGVDVGNASVAWAKRNNITNPVVGLIGNLSDAQGKQAHRLGLEHDQGEAAEREAGRPGAGHRHDRRRARPPRTCSRRTRTSTC